MTFNPLACQEIVLRALLKKNWFHEDTKLIKADAFIRDPKKDLDGLSVNVRSRTDTEGWLASFNRSFGFDSLHTGAIRAIDEQLDVGQDEDGSGSNLEHAVIAGLPFSDDDPDRAESLASRLALISRTSNRAERKNKR